MIASAFLRLLDKRLYRTIDNVYLGYAARHVAQFSRRNRKEFYGNRCIERVQKQRARYLPHSLAMTTSMASVTLELHD